MTGACNPIAYPIHVVQGGETALAMAAAAPRKQEKVLDMTYGNNFNVILSHLPRFKTLGRVLGTVGEITWAQFLLLRIPGFYPGYKTWEVF